MPLTTDPNDPCLKNGQKETGQNNCYLVLSEEERAKGFMRPYRDAYIHRGRKVERDEKGRIIGRLIKIDDADYPVNDHFTKEKGYGGYIEYPKGHNSLGRYLDIEEVEAIVNRKTYFGGCGAVTTMGRSLSETYATQPSFYSATFCVGCNKHLPVSEFIWADDLEVVGS